MHSDRSLSPGLVQLLDDTGTLVRYNFILFSHDDWQVDLGFCISTLPKNMDKVPQGVP